MTEATLLWTPTITRAELEPVVAQVLRRPHGGVAEWRLEPIGGETLGSHLAGGRGIYRLAGSAHGQAAGQVYPWSLVVKIFSDAALGPTPNDIGDTIQDPTDGNYWKREILVYQSGMLDELAGGLVAPRGYGVTEHAGEWRLWLEDVEESPKTWPLERYGVAARQLGQFNGAYLVDRAAAREAAMDVPGPRPRLEQNRMQRADSRSSTTGDRPRVGGPAQYPQQGSAPGVQVSRDQGIARD